MGREEGLLLESATGDRLVWEPAGKGIRVGLELTVVDRLLRDVKSAFGSTPRRGVEIGGILLGSIQEDGTISIQEYERVECSHENGPAYSLTEEERAKFAALVQGRGRVEGAANYAVGYFRSHTREGLGVSEDDVKIFDELFPEDGNVILIVKPYATRASRAGIFFRENGAVHRESCCEEFDLRPTEPAGEPEPSGGSSEVSCKLATLSDTISCSEASRPEEGNSSASAPTIEGTPVMNTETTAGILGINQPTAPGGGDQVTSPSRRGWIWLPLSFVFLLLGVFLGIQVSVSVGQKLPGALRAGDPLALGLNATSSGESVHLRWDRGSSVVKSGQGARLIIGDGGAEKTVMLTQDQLQFGSVIYHRGSPQVRFRLEVEVRDRVTLTETLDFRVP